MVKKIQYIDSKTIYYGFMTSTNNDIKITKWLYLHEKNNIYLPKNNFEIFRYACKIGKYDTIKWLYYKILYDKQINTYTYNFTNLRVYMFKYACKNNDFKILRLLPHDIFKNIPNDAFIDMIYYNCKYDNLLMFKFLIDKYEKNNNYLNIIHIIKICFKFSSINIFKWLFDKNYLFIDSFDNEILFKICRYDNPEIISYLLNSVNINEISLQILFTWSCEHCYLEQTKIIYNFAIQNNITLNFRNILLQNIITYDNLDMIQWLYSKCDDLNVNNYELFKIACFDGNLKIAKWIYSKNIDIIKNKNEIFMVACFKNNIHIIRWLYAIYIKKLTIVEFNNMIEDIFTKCCLIGKLKVIEYLHIIHDEINNIIYNNNLFEIVCQNGKLNIAKWICQNVNIEDDIIYSAFGSACMNGHKKTAIWIYEKLINKDISELIDLFDNIYTHCCNNNIINIATLIASLDSSRYYLNINELDGNFVWSILNVYTDAKFQLNNNNYFKACKILKIKCI